MLPRLQKKHSWDSLNQLFCLIKIMDWVLTVERHLLNHWWAMRNINNAKPQLYSHSAAGWIFFRLDTQWKFDFYAHRPGPLFGALDMHFHFMPHSQLTKPVPHHPHVSLFNARVIRKRRIYTFYLPQTFFFFFTFKQTTKGPAFPWRRFIKLPMAEFPGGRNGRSSFSKLFFTTRAGNTMYLLSVPVILYSAETGYWFYLCMVMHTYNMG